MAADGVRRGQRRQQAARHRAGGLTAQHAFEQHDEFVAADAPGRLLQASATSRASGALGQGITGAQFDSLVGHLVATLDKFKVPSAEKNELLGVLGPMRPAIVEEP